MVATRAAVQRESGLWRRMEDTIRRTTLVVVALSFVISCGKWLGSADDSTYNSPVRKMAMTPIFRFEDSCKCHTIDIGRIKT